MPSLLETILTILNVDIGNTYVQESLRQGPVESIFNLVFFPTVFIILFIFILTNVILKGPGLDSKGMRILLSLAVYAFIVVQGWFTLFISLSRAWFIIIILLFGLWAFVRHFIGESAGGGRAGGMPAFDGKQGIKGYVSGKLENVIKQDEEDIEKRIRDRMDNMRAIINQMKHAPPGADLGKLYDTYWSIKAEAEAAIDALSNRVKAYGVKIEKGRVKKHWDDITKLTNEMQNAYNKSVKSEDVKKKKSD